MIAFTSLSAREEANKPIPILVYATKNKAMYILKKSAAVWTNPQHQYVIRSIIIGVIIETGNSKIFFEAKYGFTSYN